MPRPFGSPIVLSDLDRKQLQTLVRPLHAASPCLPLSPHPPGRGRRTNPPTSNSPMNCTVIDIPSATWRERFVAARPGRPPRCTTLRHDPGAFPPTNSPPSSALPPARPRSMTNRPHAGPSTTWPPPSSTRPITAPSAGPPSGVSSTDADLKPHQSVYWLNSHDPDFDAKARPSAGCTSTPLVCTSRADW